MNDAKLPGPPNCLSMFSIYILSIYFHFNFLIYLSIPRSIYPSVNFPFSQLHLKRFDVPLKEVIWVQVSPGISSEVIMTRCAGQVVNMRGDLTAESRYERQLDDSCTEVRSHLGLQNCQHCLCLSIVLITSDSKYVIGCYSTGLYCCCHWLSELAWA